MVAALPVRAVVAREEDDGIFIQAKLCELVEDPAYAFDRRIGPWPRRSPWDGSARCRTRPQTASRRSGRGAGRAGRRAQRGPHGGCCRARWRKNGCRSRRASVQIIQRLAQEEVAAEVRARAPFLVPGKINRLPVPVEAAGKVAVCRRVGDVAEEVIESLVVRQRGNPAPEPKGRIYRSWRCDNPHPSTGGRP